VYAHDEPGSHVTDNRVRSFFSYRDLPSGPMGDGRMLFQEVRAVGTPEGGTGWHHHTMSQLFYVLTGTVEISVEGHGTMNLVPGDAMCIRAGMVHNVSVFSPDYTLVELCVPAVYDTTPVDAPAS
jgi:quercetin dioxygenase-like cupin family protein